MAGAGIALVESGLASCSVAQPGGIAAWLAALWPLMIGGGPLIFAAVILYDSLHGCVVRWNYATVAAFVLLSIVFNIWDSVTALLQGSVSDTAILRVAVHMVPPAVLALAFEVFMRQMRREAGKRTDIVRIGQLGGEIASRHTERAAAGKRLDSVRAQVSVERQHLAELQGAVAEERPMPTHAASAQRRAAAARGAHGGGRLPLSWTSAARRCTATGGC